MRTLLIATALISAPAFVFAAGSGDSSPPKPTATTTQCSNGQVFDDEAAACVDPKESRLDDDTLYRAVREFAYAGMYAETLATLDLMSDQQEDRVLTYRGFAHRKAGDIDTGMAFYQAALTANPDNFLARSYMGQAYVELGNTEAARMQLSEIRTRGGRGTWAEFSLRTAIESGQGYSY
ncbi:MAG: tetratricopeptide repeat protein [Pseudomonadota bacterium]